MPTWGVDTLPSQRVPQKILKKSISLYYTAASGLVLHLYIVDPGGSPDDRPAHHGWEDVIREV